MLLVGIAILNGRDPSFTCGHKTDREAWRFSKLGSQFLQGPKGDRLNSVYPLVNIQKTMENHHFLLGKLTIDGNFQ